MNAQLLKRMILSHNTQNDEGFVDAVRQVIASERRQGHTKIADDLERSLETARRSRRRTEGTGLAAVYEFPRVRGEELPFVEVRSGAQTLDDIVLARDTELQVTRFLREYAHRGRLAEHGLSPTRKLLFHGPPGNGKTLCAEVIAGELGLPLYYVRFDALIASYLGETATNLRKVFDFAHRRTGVLFFDEVDAIARTRDDRDDVGELKRVVNSLLQLLDGDTSEGPVIAATNHERSLDEAIWRRFDDVILFPRPDDAQLREYLRRRLRGVRMGVFSLDDAVAACAGMCLSDVARIMTDALKTMVLDGENELSSRMFDAAVARHQAARGRREAGSGNG